MKRRGRGESVADRNVVGATRAGDGAGTRARRGRRRTSVSAETGREAERRRARRGGGRRARGAKTRGAGQTTKGGSFARARRFDRAAPPGIQRAAEGFRIHPRAARRGGAPVRAKKRRREGLVRGRSSRSSRTLLGPGAALERGGARSAARGRVAELGGARGEGAAEHDGVDRVGRRRRDARREDGEGEASARSRTHAGGDPFRARRERPRDARCAFVWW